MHKQRVWPEYRTFELGVKLHPHKPRVAGYFDNLNELRIRVDSRRHHAGGLEVIDKLIVELPAVAVALADVGFAVNLVSF